MRRSGNYAQNLTREDGKKLLGWVLVLVRQCHNKAAARHTTGKALSQAMMTNLKIKVDTETVTDVMITAS